MSMDMGRMFSVEELESRLEMAEWVLSAGVSNETTVVDGSVKMDQQIGVGIKIIF